VTEECQSSLYSQRAIANLLQSLKKKSNFAELLISAKVGEAGKRREIIQRLPIQHVGVTHADQCSSQSFTSHKIN